MAIETIFERLLLLATLLCSLNAGLLFAFAAIVMPGLNRLEDGEFIRAFQQIDGIIQNNQPLFILVWVGSAAALLIATVLGIPRLESLESSMLLIACLAYFIGVQLSTVVINIPLNNRLKSVDTNLLDCNTIEIQRRKFESRWVTWNKNRTFVAISVSAMLILLVHQL